MPDGPNAMDEDWRLLKTFFPEGWEAAAAKSGALKGLRKDKSAEGLLRTLLMHAGAGASLRETAALARQAGLADLSDVALLKRLRKSRGWLCSLCVGLFAERPATPAPDSCGDMLLLDASVIRESGKTGSQWRLHYCLRWPSLVCESFTLTPIKGAGSGESFARFPVVPGARYLADRGYCTPAGIRHVAGGGAFLIVRVNPAAVRITHPGPEGEVFPLADRLAGIDRPGMVGEWPVTLADATGAPAAAGRLCVIRKSEEAIRTAHRKLRRNASKKQTALRPETLEHARYVMIFTNIPVGELTTAEALERYRARWQIELVFKRFKQMARLGHLPKRDPESSKAWLYGKLFVALLTEKLVAHAAALSPWGYGGAARDTGPPQEAERLA